MGDLMIFPPSWLKAVKEGQVDLQKMKAILHEQERRARLAKNRPYLAEINRYKRELEQAEAMGDRMLSSRKERK